MPRYVAAESLQAGKTMVRGSARPLDLECDREAVGRRLRLLEEACGVSPDQLATLLCSSRDTYFAWRTGRERLPPEAALTLKRNFGCALDWLYIGDATHNDPDFQARIARCASESP